MNEPVRVACVQAEPAILDRERTLEKLAALTAEAKAGGARLVWLVTGVNERDPERPGTLYNALLYHGPDGRLALHHRKLVPTNHERLIWARATAAGSGRSRRRSAESVA